MGLLSFSAFKSDRSGGSIMRITNEADEKTGVEQCLSLWTGRVCSLRPVAITAAASSSLLPPLPSFSSAVEPRCRSRRVCCGSIR